MPSRIAPQIQKRIDALVGRNPKGEGPAPKKSGPPQADVRLARQAARPPEPKARKSSGSLDALDALLAGFESVDDYKAAQARRQPAADPAAAPSSRSAIDASDFYGLKPRD